MQSPSTYPTPPPTTPDASAPVTGASAQLLGWMGWLGFWAQMLVGAVITVLLVLAMISRSLSEGEHTLGVGVAIALAIAGIVALLIGTVFAFRLTRYARQIRLPQPGPKPSVKLVHQQVALALMVSFVGLGIGLLGTEVSTVSLLAKALSNPQGAAVYTPESTLRVLDIIVILVNAGLAIAHFCGQAANYWLLRRL